MPASQRGPPRRIVLLRHAEATTDQDGPDRDRKLTAKGEAQAARRGAQLRRLGLLPDAIVCSPAARALQTARLAAAAAASAVAIESDAALWEAGVDDILACLGRHAKVGTLWVVAHNPGLHETTVWLADQGLDHLDKGCAVVLEATGALREGSAHLVRFLGD